MPKAAREIAAAYLMAWTKRFAGWRLDTPENIADCQNHVSGDGHPEPVLPADWHWHNRAKDCQYRQNDRNDKDHGGWRR